ncbi:MAG: RNA methyltransferase [Rhodospirillales bacterium]|jgi:tRNA G18 (ribose-2'-O)-methylase SpoU|nr:RNA methyltransferase [Rhodospirillales bacterium]
MRGYFGVGVESISKAMNVGSLFRTAHAFGASFVFTVAADYERKHVSHADTSKAQGHVPFYEFPDINSMILPQGCDIVGIELTDDAVELPSFHHPRQAAYILGPEKGSLSPTILERCAYTVKIPTKFCINVGLAGAITLYDRAISMGQYAPRHIVPGAPVESVPEHKHGGRFTRKKDKELADLEPFRTDPPLGEVDIYSD